MPICLYLNPPWITCKLDNTPCDRRRNDLRGCPKLDGIKVEHEEPLKPKTLRDAKGHFMRREAQ